MNNRIYYERFFSVTKDYTKTFHAKYSKGVNIVYGRNTSGKSTVLQAILYTLGINDVKEKLSEILESEPIFRLDLTIENKNTNTKCIFIRDDNFIYIKEGEKPFVKYSGINSDNSLEHINYKNYFHCLLNSNFKLNTRDEYKTAPIEALLLPFYISQDVGWVYLRRSFSNMDFYKNFKDDYLDHFFGVENDTDKERRISIESSLLEIGYEISQIERIQNSSAEIVISKIEDENAPIDIPSYLSDYSQQKSAIASFERKLLLLCNKLAHLNERKKIISVVEHNNLLTPIVCPTCQQNLPSTISQVYQRKQDLNDTESQLNTIKSHIKETQTEIDQIEKRIISLREQVARKYQILEKRPVGDFSMKEWITMKANIQIDQNLSEKRNKLLVNQADLKQELKELTKKTNVDEQRTIKSREFSILFNKALIDLHLTHLSEERFSNIYKISSFPFQGVELLRTVMAYHFSFGHLIQDTSGITIFPFMCDAIFKEDIDEKNREIILRFVGSRQSDFDQIILTIAHSENSTFTLSDINKNYFNSQADLLNLGNSNNERAFFSAIKTEDQEILNETISIINQN